MKKQMIWAISAGLLSLTYLGFSFYRESQVYYQSVADCDQYRESNKQKFMECWRTKRNATHTLRKHYGYLP